MKDFWKYWTLFIAIVVIPINGYLFGIGVVNTTVFLILCLMQLPIISKHIIGDKQ